MTTKRRGVVLEWYDDGTTVLAIVETNGAVNTLIGQITLSRHELERLRTKLQQVETKHDTSTP